METTPGFGADGSEETVKFPAIALSSFMGHRRKLGNERGFCLGLDLYLSP